MPKSRANPQRTRRAVRKADRMAELVRDLREENAVLKSLAVSIIPPGAAKLPKEVNQEELDDFKARQMELLSIPIEKVVP